MFAKFLSRVKALPPRSGDWANKLGPVALMGCSGGAHMSSTKLLNHFYTSPRDCDMYAELTFHEPGPVECPPETVIFFPVIQCGEMLDDKSEPSKATKDDWYLAMTEATTELLEKGYVPVSAGGDGSATLAMVEAYKRLFRSSEVVLIHCSARPALEKAEQPIRVLLEKDLLKGVVEIGNRCVSSGDRKVRKQHKVMYMDMQAIYAKGLFCIRDIRNDYPVFLSIDADVLDPAFAPAVQSPVPGGLSTRDLLHIMTGIRGPKVAGIDIHGYHPSLDMCRSDGVGLTQMALTKVLKESIVKAYTISTQTAEEGLERVRLMQRQGTLSDNPYPDY
ncbi:agmatinase-like protein [Leishmania mexicana MHOM/GT/2001/U1103]|uniref:Agmatinase-like protein n=1 Tax=Leishmania mexicana (strain MHOM/GT/2001/U1103) TaxID=929439 RepID=E9AW07_LEIMU|nr:agmatinase-like protein [Leishmania mexicana MHOM/GT/2001/U1103]CBZ27141.1 agmatinase-like protein [Leishmania mexicana MHOM/GT/2001/U1103]